MTEIPVLEGDRIRLREHRPGDLDDYAVLWSDETVVRNIGGRPLGRSDCWNRILRFHGMWALLGLGFWIIEDRQSGLLAGEAGIMDLRRDIEPSLDGSYEAGWALMPAFHGQGLASEAMRLVLDWADRHHPSTPLSCIIAEENQPSLRLAAKLDFTQSGSGEYQGNRFFHFRRAARADAAMASVSA